jgi:UDPglucose 6-dehydrogenase
MDEKSAEMTKYVANSFLATKISFMNEVANLCELLGADVDAVRMGVGSDDRIGKRFLFPGIGYGGSCFPKDVMALEKMATSSGYDFKILEAVSLVNSTQKEIIINKIMDHYNNNVKGKIFALWGLAFKPDTDDIREAPAIQIIKGLIAAGARIVAYDPQATENVKKVLGSSKDNITYKDDEYESLKNADALIIATEWSVFRTPDFMKMKKLLKEPIIFDGRNIYELDSMRENGFHYESIGRGKVSA